MYKTNSVVSGLLVTFVVLVGFSYVFNCRADVITMSDLPGADDPALAGEKKDADKDFSPASTFKMIIALTAFEQKIATPDTHLRCKDNVMATYTIYSFNQAMVESNNDFFMQLVDKLTDAQLLDMAARCSFGTVKGEVSRNRFDWIHGGPIRVTPKQEHQFLRQLVRGKLPVNVIYQKDLLTVMKWPDALPGVDVYGKTGSWENTFWFSGIAVKHSGARVITVTLTSFGKSSRALAIKTFLDHINSPLPGKNDNAGMTDQPPGSLQQGPNQHSTLTNSSQTNSPSHSGQGLQFQLTPDESGTPPSSQPTPQTPDSGNQQEPAPSQPSR